MNKQWFENKGEKYKYRNGKQEKEQETKNDNEEKKGFWKWTFSKWYFWLFVILHFFIDLIIFSKPFNIENLLMSFIVFMAVWSFIFWILYLINNNGIHKKRNV